MIEEINTRPIDHISLARFKRRITDKITNTIKGWVTSWVNSLFGNISVTADATSSTQPTVTSTYDEDTGVLSLAFSGLKGAGIAIKQDAASCTSVGDAYIDKTSSSQTYGHIMICTSLSPKTFSDGGTVRGPKGDDGLPGSQGPSGETFCQAYMTNAEVAITIGGHSMGTYTGAIANARLIFTKDKRLGGEEMVNFHITMYASGGFQYWGELFHAVGASKLQTCYMGLVSGSITGGTGTVYLPQAQHGSKDQCFGIIHLLHDNNYFPLPNEEQTEWPQDETHRIMIEIQGCVSRDVFDRDTLYDFFNGTITCDLNWTALN